MQITGILLLSVGAVIQGLYASYSSLLDDGFFSVPALLIAVGAIVFIVSFFGCCGAVKENHCMILTVSIPNIQGWLMHFSDLTLPQSTLIEDLPFLIYSQ